MINKKVIGVILMLILSTGFSSAQKEASRKYRHTWGVAGGIIGTIYLGDYTGDDNLFGEGSVMKPGIGIMVINRTCLLFESRFQYANGMMSSEMPGVSFESDYNAFALTAAINISNLLGKKRINRTLSIMLPVGLGFISYNSELTKVTGIEKKISDNSFFLTAGMEVYFNISDRFGWNICATANHPFSDKLDTYEGNKNDMFFNIFTGINFWF